MALEGFAVIHASCTTVQWASDWFVAHRAGCMHGVRCRVRKVSAGRQCRWKWEWVQGYAFVFEVGEAYNWNAAEIAKAPHTIARAPW